MKLLVVDDDPKIVNAICLHLEHQDFELVTAFNGDDAWEIIQQEQISIIICDWRMPGYNGTDLIRMIRNHQQFNYTYFILISELKGREVYLMSMEAGADDFFSKPIDEETILSRIQVAKRILHLQDQLYQTSYKDVLTGLSNRRKFDDVLHHEWRRSARTHHSLSLLMIDIDHFKLYNDNYGHLEGDMCLKKVSHIFREFGLRAGDLVARYGGEEFCVILSDTDEKHSLFVAESMRKEIESAQLKHEYSPVASYVTISIGLASIIPNMKLNPDVLIQLADEALYEAKRKGRNRVETFIKEV